MKGKLSFIIFLINFNFNFGLFAEVENSKNNFSHPLRIQPVAVYTKVRIDGVANENRDGESYSRDRAIRVEGEYKIRKTISISSSMGRTIYERSKADAIRENDRFNLGMHYAKEVSLSFGTIVIGGGIQLFNASTNKAPKRDTENPALYLVRPHISFGIKMGALEVQSELRFQTETNPALKEKFNEEFRRYFQGGLSISYGFTDSLRFFMETEYRQPYNKTVDTETKFWNAYPGISYRLGDKALISGSVLIPLAIEKYTQDRGVRLSLFYFF